MVVDEIELCTVAEVDGAGKGPRKSDSKAVELHLSIGAIVDDPGVHASTTAVRRRSVKAARASPVAVALAEERSGHLPLRDHNRDRSLREWEADDKGRSHFGDSNTTPGGENTRRLRISGYRRAAVS